MDGVLTSKDFINQKKIESGEIKPPDSNKNNRIEYRYKFPPAPKGKSQTTLYFKDKPMKVVMEDGIFTLDKKWSKKEKEQFHLFVLNLGFEDACIIENIKKNENNDNESLKIYKIGHPDNTKTDKINGNVSIIINNEEKQFECIDGAVTTEDKDIFHAFIKKGWYEISITKKEE